MDLTEKFRDWVPVRVYPHDGQMVVDWCWLGDVRFTQPFFDSTINERLRLPFNNLFRHQTSIDLAGELHAREPGLEPTAPGGRPHPAIENKFTS